MATKENYQDAIMRMYNFCISSNHPAQIREQFTQDLDFLAKLAEEHFEEKKETNLDYYKHEILEDCLWDLAVVKGIPKLCNKTNCSDCDFKNSLKECHKKIIDWLKQPYIKPTYKLTQFEYDLLQHFSVDFKFKEMGLLKEMKEKGHFKNINGDELIKDILESCEVIK